MVKRVVEIQVKTTNERAINRLDRSVDNVDRSAKSASSSLFTLSRVASSVGAALFVRRVIAYADAWTEVQTQLKLVTSSQEELVQVTNDLLGVANRTRQDFDATANLYARLARATTELNVSQADLLQVTTAINQAFVVSGASAQEAQAAIVQLSQGLASGTLRGDEFNSVAEQAPRLLQAIADATGRTRGELRELAAQGQITSQLVFESLRDQAGAIASEFEQATPTVASSLTVLNNKFQELVGTVDQASGATEKLSTTIIDFTDSASNSVDALGKSFKFWADVVVALSEDPFFSLGGPIPVVIEQFNQLEKRQRDSIIQTFSQIEAYKGLSDQLDNLAGKLPAGGGVLLPGQTLPDQGFSVPTAGTGVGQPETIGADVSQPETSILADRLRRETELLKTELELRQLVQDGFLTEEEARVNLAFETQLANNKLRLDQELAQLGENETAKQELLTEFRNNQLLETQLFQDNLTAIQDDGTKARINLDQAELQSKIALTSGALSLLSAFGIKSKTLGKALRLAQAATNAFQVYSASEAAAALVLATPPGPVLNPSLIPIAAGISAKGKLSAAAVLAGAAAGTFSGSSGGGGAASSAAAASPGITGPTQTQLTTVNTIESTALTDLNNELRNLDPDEQLPVSFVRRIVNSVAEVTSTGQG